MERASVEDYFDSMDNLDFTLASHSIQPSSPTPTEDGSPPVRYNYDTAETFYDIDVDDLNMSLYPDQNFRDLLNELRAVDQLSASSPIIDDISELLGESAEVHSTESNDVSDPIQSADEHLAMIKSSDPSLPITRPQTEKLPTKTQNDQSIALSSSVAVTVPTPNQLQLVYPLEETYRARYKSDYFPQKGEVRRPRYVADNAGNHFVSLKMPELYNRDFKHEYVRIALITTSINGRGHFYSPYKFQTNHRDVKVPDQNPIYIPVHANQGNDYTMRLQLVLIKSKLDQLNYAQPLKPFSDTIVTVQNIINEEKLSPKDLINKYQLDKSQLAFTLCTKSSNGTYDIHPETTIISSIITESPPKPSGKSNNQPQPTTTTTKTTTGKKICCPKCSHSFDLVDGDTTTEKGNKRKSVTTSSASSSKTSTNTRTNKKKKNC